MNKPIRQYSIVKTIIGLSFIAMLSACGAKQEETDPKVGKNTKPNVIVIMTDDQGYGDIAAHGHPIIKTPNLDDLHADSIRLTDFHVNSFCAPTRAALMTGRLSDRTHVRTTVYSRNFLNLEETTMAEFFKASGYKTGQFGKWHIGHNYPYRPIDRGFDEWVGHGDGGTGTVSDYWGNDKMNDHYLRNGKWEAFEGYGNDVFFNETIKFIENNKQQPFFAYLATNIPHGPWNVLKEDGHIYDDVDGSKIKAWPDTKDFLTLITRFDKNVGKLRDYLQDTGLDKNTILVFLTDNGTSRGAHVFNAGMRGGKGSLYEGGHRVPFYIHWPEGGLSGGKDINEFTAHTDLLPTLIGLAGLQTPERGHLPFDGQDLSALLAGKTKTIDDRYFIMHQQNVMEMPVKGLRSLVATKQWRLINGKALYDIQNDRHQDKNVAAKYPDVVKQLNQIYDQHWQELALEKQAYPRPVVGSGNDEETWLTPDSWVRDETELGSWDQSHIVTDNPVSGFWPVNIAKTGMYEFEVRRWPKEANISINQDSAPLNTPDVFKNGLPIVKLGYGKGDYNKEQDTTYYVRSRLELGEVVLEQPIPTDHSAVRFTTQLTAGSKDIRAWFLTDKGKERAAYYVYIRKLD